MNKYNYQGRIFQQNQWLYNSAGYLTAGYPKVVQRKISWTDYSVRGPNVPHWRDKLKIGADVTTSLTGFRRQLFADPYGFYRTGDNCGTYANARIRTGAHSAIDASLLPTTGYTTLNGSLVTEAERVARRKIHQKRVARTQDFSGGVFLAELHETVHFLKQPLASFNKLTLDLGRGLKDLQKRKAFLQKRESAKLRVLTDTWLAYKFAVAPTLNDIDSGITAIQNHLDKGGQKSPKIRIVALGGADLSTKVGQFTIDGVSAFKVDVQETIHVSVKVATWYTPPSGNVDRTAQRFGVAPEDWIPSVYAVIPYSWLLDYVTNVGDIVDAFSDNLFVSYSHSWRTVRQQYKRIISTGYVQPPYVGCRQLSLGRVIDSSTIVQRLPYAMSDYMPPLKFKLPNLKKALNVAALINSIESLKAPKR